MGVAYALMGLTRSIMPIAWGWWADTTGRRIAMIRWAVIALQQAERHLSGREPSLELALTGRISAELELEALRLIEANDPTEAPR